MEVVRVMENWLDGLLHVSRLVSGMGNIQFQNPSPTSWNVDMDQGHMSVPKAGLLQDRSLSLSRMNQDQVATEDSVCRNKELFRGWA